LKGEIVSPTNLTRQSTRHSRLRVSALLFSAGLVAAALTIGAPLAANADPTPTITLSETTITPWGTFGVSGTGFTANSNLTFLLDSTDVTEQIGHPHTDAGGAFTVAAGALRYETVEGGSVGTHTLTVTDASTLSATAALEVIGEIVPRPATATRTISQMISSGVTFSLSGFLPGDSVTAGIGNRFGGSECSDPVTADEAGHVTLTCVWDAAFIAEYGSIPAADVYTASAVAAMGSRQSVTLMVTVIADPAAPAVPAVPIAGKASFTG
jgi:hypothetical protein